MAFEATDAFWAPGIETATERRAGVFRWRGWLAPLLTCIGYYVGSQIGFALTFQPHPVSVLWPPNAILLAALLLTPTQRWGWVLLGAFPAHCLVQLQTAIPVPMMLCYFISNSCEALIGAGCIRYLVAGQFSFDSLRSTAIFCLCGGLLAPFLSSFLDAGFVRLNQWGAGNFWELWRVRLFSNVLSALTFAPAIVMWFTRPQTRPAERNRTALLEAAVLFLGLAVASYVAFYMKGPTADPVLFLAPLPFLLWAALRLGARGTTTAILIVTFLAIWSAAHGHGPFTGETPEQNARSLQLFLIVMAIPFLFLSAGIRERQVAEERFSKAFRCSPDPMWIARLADGKLFDVNEQWEKLFGHARQESIGQTSLEINLWADLADRAEMVRRVRQGPVREFETRLCNKAGESVPVLLSADVVEINGERSLVIIIRDISDRKRAEEADRNLAHATRLAVLGELTASIAHEINQPLGAILSNADAAEMLLEADSPPLDELRKIVSDIRGDDLRASETIRHIRTLTAKRGSPLLPLDLHDLIFYVVRLIKGDAARRGVVIENHLNAEISKVSGDTVHLQQVLINLMINAMDAMSDTPEGRRRLTIATTSEADDEVEISVSDSGCGLPPEKLSRLFESFFTTKESGVGLGLAIVRSIIDAHHGRISAANNLEGGATFRIRLPLLKEDLGAV